MAIAMGGLTENVEQAPNDMSTFLLYLEWIEFL